MKQGPERFLPKNELEERTKLWRSTAKIQEETEIQNGNRLYTFNRLNEDVRKFHDISFIEDVIPKLIASKKKGEKVKILDVGAGAAFFTDQIRKTFSDKVKVFSTGLSKKAAVDFRKKNKPEGESSLHPNDLKWYSILQLSDFEEFDLIIDTVGEFAYSIPAHAYDDSIQAINETQERALRYLTVVIKKLKPGGLASIASACFVNYDSFPGKEALHRLEEEYNVTITNPKEYSDVLRIEKNKPK